MTRILISIAVVLTVVGGGAYYVMHRNDVAVAASAPAPSAQSQSNTVVIERKSNDEELNKKRLEGIGSVKKLKPVELGPTLEQEAAAKKH